MKTINQSAEGKEKIHPVTGYFKTHDAQYIAEDAEFTDLTTGNVTKGRIAVGEMLNHIYHVAFDARAEIINTIITDDKAVMEAQFSGKHTGEFAGIPATNKDVNVPMCVVYDIEDQKIKRARIYMLASVMMQQLNS